MEVFQEHITSGQSSCFRLRARQWCNIIKFLLQSALGELFGSIFVSSSRPFGFAWGVLYIVGDASMKCPLRLVAVTGALFMMLTEDCCRVR